MNIDTDWIAEGTEGDLRRMHSRFYGYVKRAVTESYTDPASVVADIRALVVRIEAEQQRED
jgi:hypothetical protein